MVPRPSVLSKEESDRVACGLDLPAMETVLSKMLTRLAPLSGTQSYQGFSNMLNNFTPIVLRGLEIYSSPTCNNPKKLTRVAELAAVFTRTSQVKAVGEYCQDTGTPLPKSLEELNEAFLTERPGSPIYALRTLYGSDVFPSQHRGTLVPSSAPQGTCTPMQGSVRSLPPSPARSTAKWNAGAQPQATTPTRTSEMASTHRKGHTDTVEDTGVFKRPGLSASQYRDKGKAPALPSVDDTGEAPSQNMPHGLPDFSRLDARHTAMNTFEVCSAVGEQIEDAETQACEGSEAASTLADSEIVQGDKDDVKYDPTYLGRKTDGLLKAERGTLVGAS